MRKRGEASQWALGWFCVRCAARENEKITDWGILWTDQLGTVAASSITPTQKM